MSTMVIRIGFRDAMNPMTLRISTPAAKNEARDNVAMSPMLPAARRSSSGSRLVTAPLVNTSPTTIANMKTRYPPSVLGSPDSPSNGADARSPLGICAIAKSEIRKQVTRLAITRPRASSFVVTALTTMKYRKTYS